MAVKERRYGNHEVSFLIWRLRGGAGSYDKKTEQMMDI